MEGISLSVIIPTYNRRSVLEKSLNALLQQDFGKKDFEIIVVDDGSTDSTGSLVKSVAEKSSIVIRYYRQENSGPAAARNLALKSSEGKIVLFLGDDIVAGTSLLKEHFSWHFQYPEDNLAVLGKVAWSPEVKMTPFINFLENNNIQFSHPSGSQTERQSYKYFYSSNVSLKRNFLLREGIFDESFKYAACEDIELGCRLQKKGLVIRYNENAIGFHYHPFSLNEYCSRMFQVGISSVILSRRHPDFFGLALPAASKLKTVIKKLIYPVIRNFISFFDYYFGFNFNNWYERLLDYYKMEGIKEAKRRSL